MNKRVILSFLGILAVGLLTILWANRINAVKPVEDFSALTLELRADKEIYTLGEAVQLGFRFTNTETERVQLKHRPDVWTGYLKVWIASEGSPKYKPYNNTSWGLRESGGIVIEPGKFFESKAAILWNSKPDLANLNPNIAREKITSDFAFATAGAYYIKATYTLSDEKKTTIESPPLRVVFTEPTGDNLIVWSQIKDNREIAHFLEQSGFITSDLKKKEALLTVIDGLTDKYPEAFIAQQLMERREIFVAKELKRKALLENATVRKN